MGRKGRKGVRRNRRGEVLAAHSCARARAREGCARRRTIVMIKLQTCLVVVWGGGVAAARLGVRMRNCCCKGLFCWF